MDGNQILLSYFENMDKDSLIQAIIEFDKNNLLPLDSLIYILEETTDLELVAVIMECLKSRLDEIDDHLVLKYKSVSKVVKQYFVGLFAQSFRSKHTMFLLDEYFYDPYMRPYIRKVGFKDKKSLFMNLVRYFEDIPFTKENVDTAQNILKSIPKDTILSCMGVFNGAKLLDVYYAIPLDERES